MNEMDFSEISRDDIINAFREYDRLENENKLNAKRKAKDYILFWNSKEYPHKYIVGIAYGLKYHQEILDNNLYSSSGHYKASAQWCIEKNGFDLYADSKYKQFLQANYDNKTTINTYYSDLKKVIKIFQNIPEYYKLPLNELLSRMQNDEIDFEKYDKSQRELGYNDNQLFTTYKTKVKTYLQSLKDDKLMDSDIDLQELLKTFILQSRTENQKNKHYKGTYKECYLEASFGRGALANIPWLVFLSHDQKVQNGIYPVLLLNKEEESLSIAFGVSETYKPKKIWSQMDSYNYVDIQKYNHSFLYKKINNIYSSDIDYSNIVNDIDFVIEKFHKEFQGEKSMPNSTNKSQPLNQILYGPPGTGKTYNAINKALEIIFEREDPDKKFDILEDKNGKKIYSTTYTEAVESGEREALTAIFELYRESGQIEFVTFHQSYGYEEFVEGIRAQTIVDDDTKKKTITYDVEAGIFKRLCEQAKEIKSQKQSIYNFDEKINIWKISLGDSQNSEDDYLFDYCIENNKILLGFGDYLDFSDCKNRQEIANKLNDKEKYSYPPTAINTLKNKMQKDDIVLVSYGNKKLRAIAKITEEYKYLDDENLKSYVQSRGVEWLLIPEEPFLYEKVLKKQFSQMSIYDIKSNVKIDALKNLLTKKAFNREQEKNYILIIDEINRGNISKIFGELITLIEPSKRIDADEALYVRLPYSSESFGVPKNFYIIGTMNTADRSIALMDTALRRRFEFSEMMPNPFLLHDDLSFLKNNPSFREWEDIDNWDFSNIDKNWSFDKDYKGEDILITGSINIRRLLFKMNQRIECLYDRDHTIGHAYFMSLQDKNGEVAKAELDNIFKNKIIPLLQEYFYDDWEKIQIVLGDHPEQFKKKGIKQNFNQYQFIASKELKENDILGFDHPDIENESVVYKINTEFKKEAYLKVYGVYPQIVKDHQEETN